MITEHYRTSEFDEWSGWRDSNSRHPAPKACNKEKRVFSETVCLQLFLRISNN